MSEQYFLDGNELRLPSVAKIHELLKKNENFAVVGGGGSGKTESINTAVTVLGRKTFWLDLSKYTIQVLHDFAVKKRSKNDLVQESTKQIQQMLDDVQKYSSKGSDALMKFLKASYRKESTIKDIQSQWLSFQLHRISSGKDMTESSILSKQYENSFTCMQEFANQLKENEDAAIILDECDFTLGNHPLPSETSAVLSCVDIAKAIASKHKNLVVAVILHPPIMNDSNFVTQFKEHLAKNKGDNIELVDLNFLPRELCFWILTDMFKISPNLAEKFESEIQGLPSAYFAFIGNRRKSTEEALSKCKDDSAVNTVLENIINETEKYIERLSRIIVEGCSIPSKTALFSLAKGDEISQLSNEQKLEIKRTLFAYEKDCKFQMPPVVCRAVTKYSKSKP